MRRTLNQPRTMWNREVHIPHPLKTDITTRPIFAVGLPVPYTTLLDSTKRFNTIKRMIL